ncbi:alpha/beta fold hydrolase [Sphingomonas sp. PAMC 26617]|uniref:alpha/beta fold hydrolase n=1 Tax=Sphingomonas sp. PAMC 26617 TaxID=1112216 RepID=UPI00028A0860|nr:alpha/beta hydrolase [Sphingomonas sp. PAMC 26617]
MRWPIVGYGVAALVALLIIAFLYYRTPDTDPAAMRAKYGAPPSQFVDLGNGLTVHLRDTGPRDAPVLMLIHGSNASLQTWEPWAERLAQRYRIIRMDLPGHGLTGASPTRDYTPAAYVDVVERIRTKLCVDHIVLAGNSMGGGVAWHYALAHPELLRGLVLIDSVGQPEPGNAKPPLAFRIARLPVLREIAAAITPRSLIADSLPGVFGDPKLADAAMIDRYWELLRYPGNRKATLDRFALAPDSATTAQLAALRLPVLILWGAKDQLIPRASGDWLHARIPGSKLIVYPGTGHLPMEERPDESARDVERFVQGLRDGSILRSNRSP